MDERTTQIRPLSANDTQHVSSHLINYPDVRTFKESYFSTIGVFQLATRDQRPGEISMTPRMWTQYLLKYDPKQTILTTFRGQLIVRNQQNSILESIPPSEIRRVGPESEIGVVQKSGYVLANHFYTFRGNQGIGMEEYDQILQLADKDRRTPVTDEHTRVKVDPVLQGKKLWVCIFDLELARTIWDREAVVIDPETRQMIEREVLRPLSAKRWG